MRDSGNGALHQVSVQYNRRLWFVTPKCWIVVDCRAFRMHYSCTYFWAIADSVLCLFYLVYFSLWELPPTHPLLKSLGIPGQPHVKAIRQKVSEMGARENQRDFKGMSQKQADAVALHYTRFTHTCWQKWADFLVHTNSRTVSLSHIKQDAACSERISLTKNTHLLFCLTIPISNTTSLVASLELLLDLSFEEPLMYNSVFNKCGWSKRV